MKNKHLTVIFLLFFLVATIGFAKEEFQDHPLITPVGNSEIQHQETSNLDEYTLALSPVEDKKIKEQKTVIGKISKTTYRASENTSPFEIYHYLKNFFSKNKFLSEDIFFILSFIKLCKSVRDS